MKKSTTTTSTTTSSTSSSNFAVIFLESWLCLAEYFLILVGSNALFGSSFLQVNAPGMQFCVDKENNSNSSNGNYLLIGKCLLGEDILALLVGFFKFACKLCIIATYMFWRYRDLFTDSAVRNLPKRLGLKRFDYVTAFVVVFGVLQLLDFLVMVGIQLQTGTWLYSWTNYLTNDGQAIDYPKVITILLLAPMQEELVFRGVLFYLLYRRYPSDTFCICMSSFMFGSFHLMNMFAGQYSTVYVLLQVTLGAEIGLLYSYRFLISQTILEPIVLHIFNNIFSSIISLRSNFDFTDPFILFPIIQTVLFYLGLLLYSRAQYNKIKAAEAQKREENRLDKID